VEVLVIGLDAKGVSAAFDWVQFIDTRQKTAPATVRNLGIRAARGEILCFLDDDCLPAPGWLANILAAFERGSMVVGGGITFPLDSYWTGCDSLAHFPDVLAETPSGRRDYLPSLNFSARRSVFEHVGDFDEQFPHPAGEDTELTVRMRQAGYALWFAAEASVFHTARRSDLRQAWQRAWRFGQAVAVTPRMRDLLHPAPLFQHWLMIYLTAGPRALLATIKIFRQYPSLLKYWRFMPGVFFSKLAWQLGVASAFRQLHPQQTESTPTNLEIN
jgi:GT2 family glycosyltransferase